MKTFGIYDAPKLGVTPASRRIAKAVDNQAWQEFRISIKGKTTDEKLDMLAKYYYNNVHAHYKTKNREDCDVCIRVDNYIKALCRGGQLGPKESLVTALFADFKLGVIK